jgi:activator of HSP90 ATPase
VKTPFNHIVQSWRTDEFPAGSPDSQVEITIEPTCTGCQLTLVHTGIPDGQAQQYLQGWDEYYFRPLLNYFEKQVGETAVDMDG